MKILKKGMPEKIKKELEQFGKKYALPFLAGVIISNSAISIFQNTKDIISPKIENTINVGGSVIEERYFFEHLNKDASTGQWVFNDGEATINVSELLDPKYTEYKDLANTGEPEKSIDTIYTSSERWQSDDFHLGTYSPYKNKIKRSFFVDDAKVGHGFMEENSPPLEIERPVFEDDGIISSEVEGVIEMAAVEPIENPFIMVTPEYTGIVDKYNSDSTYTDIHEYAHHINNKKGVNDKDMSFDESYNLGYHDEVVARVYEILKRREDYIKTGNFTRIFEVSYEATPDGKPVKDDAGNAVCYGKWSKYASKILGGMKLEKTPSKEEMGLILETAYEVMPKEFYANNVAEIVLCVKSNLSQKQADKSNPEKFSKVLKDMYTIEFNGKKLSFLEMAPKKSIENVLKSIKEDKFVQDAKANLPVKFALNQCKDKLAKMRELKQDLGDNALESYIKEEKQEVNKSNNTSSMKIVKLFREIKDSIGK